MVKMRRLRAARNAGQLHPRAVLTDAEVELMRKLREDEGWTYGQLMQKFDVTKSCVQHICAYRTR